MRFRVSHLPVYLLLISVFLGNFVYQYLALAIFVGFFLVYRSPLRDSVFILIPFILLGVAILSQAYNLLTGLADKYSLLFWVVSYLPPFLLAWMLLSYRREIDFAHIYSFYKKLVYIQSFLLIGSAIEHRAFVVGDAATGTIGDANWVAFHICVVLIYEITRMVTWSKTKAPIVKNKWASIFEIFYFFIVLIIPESTANLGFLLVILALLFTREYVVSRINITGIAAFLVCSVLAFFVLKDTFVFQRIKDTVSGLTADNIERNYNFFKLSIYRKLLSGKIYRHANPLVGSGPSTFTSRSSVVRMPEERFNEIPVELPYFKNKLFATYISPAYADWRRTGASYGNFASPQATVISIAVELGLTGLFVFLFYFYCIFKKIRTHRPAADYVHRLKFAQFLTLFFLMSLFHLNFWEYPIVSYTCLILVFAVIRQKPNFEQTG